eukprot:CFRG6836T1
MRAARLRSRTHGLSAFGFLFIVILTCISSVQGATRISSSRSNEDSKARQRAQERDLMLHISNRNSLRKLLFVSTIDGALRALDIETGVESWVFEPNEPLVTTTVRLSGPIFVPDVADGSLYYFNNATMQRMPATIQDLVESSPYRGADGAMYVGQKRSRLFAIDGLSGEVYKEFSDNDPAACPVSEAILYIGRIDFDVSVMDKQGMTSWSVVYAQYTSVSSASNEDSEYQYTSHRDGRIVVDNLRTGRQWHVTYPEPVVAIYTAQHGSLVKEGIAESFSADDLHMDVGVTQEVAVGVYRGSLYGLPRSIDEKYLALADEASRCEDRTTNGNRCDAKGLDAELDRSSTGSTLIAVGCHIGHASFPQCLVGSHLVETSVPQMVVSDDDDDPTLHIQGAAKPLAIEATGETSATVPASTLVGVALSAATGTLFAMVVGLLLWRIAVKPSSSTYPSSSGSIEDNSSLLSGISGVGDDIPTHITMLDSTSSLKAEILLDEDRGETNGHDMASDNVKTISTSNGSDVISKEEPEANADEDVKARPIEHKSGSKEYGETDTTPDNWESLSELNSTPSVSITSSSSVTSGTDASGVVQRTVTADQAYQVGSLMVHPTEIIGYGCQGTMVYKGFFDRRPVAVKRMLAEYFELANQEVDLLQQFDHHTNVIRYFCKEQDSQFLYIALELCQFSLEDVVSKKIDLGLTHQTIMGDIMNGLAHLHSLNIVHRDIKPANVLVSSQNRVLISDFGLCKLLPDDKSSYATQVSGTQGWIAPEFLTHNRMTRAVDIFSAGCVLYYLVSGGEHPYGRPFEREINIRNNKPDMFLLEGHCEIYDLISDMLLFNPSDRPSASQVLDHPFFWTAENCLQFLNDVSDRYEKVHREDRALVLLEKGAFDVVGADWHKRLDHLLIDDLRKFRTYRGESVRDLMRVMRNKKNHYEELSSDLKRAMGKLPNGFYNYFRSRFPNLVMHVYKFMLESGDSMDHRFVRYFKQPPEK